MSSLILKDGTQVEDKALDRLEEFDEKSRNFPITAVNKDKSFRSYTWRCLDWFDQGREGACVGFALGHELAARPAEVRGMHYDWLVRDVYWEAQKIDPWPGGSYPGANPRYDGTSILAGVKVLHKKKFFGEYRWAFGIDDLIMGLGRNGPATLGIPWYQNMYHPDSNGYIRKGGLRVGGHAILARAVNVRTETITLRNSWGKSWGKDGDCYIKFHDLEALLKERGEAVFMLNRTAKPDGESYQF